MNGKKLTKLLCSLLALGLAANADFNAKQWHTRAPLSVQTGASISQFTVDANVYQHSSSRLSDLRILSGNVEVPYVMRVLSGELQQQERAVAIRNKAWTSEHGVQAVLDLAGHSEHNRLRIATSQHNFKQAVMIETSDDETHWATVLADGVIFDISRAETNVSDLTVTYPTSTRRYVRVTIPGWADAAFLESAWLAEYHESTATRDNLGTFKPTVIQNQQPQTTDLIFDLGRQGLPCDRMVLEAAAGLFSRSVEVSTSKDGKTFWGRGGSAIVRTNTAERLTVEWSESWERYVKLTVFNEDSAPIKIEAATASAIRRVIRFPSNGPATYWLYMSNESSHTPSYDFAKVQDEVAQAGPATVGAVMTNPEFELPSAPFSERYPWLLNLILGVAVAAMAFITYRFARKATSPTV